MALNCEGNRKEENLKNVLIDLTSLADNFSGIERFAMSVAKEIINNSSIEYILLFKNEVHKEFFEEHPHVKKIVLKGKNKLIFNQLILPLKLLHIKADSYLFLAFPAPFLFFNKQAISVIHDLGCWDCPSTNRKYITWYFKILYKKAALGNKTIITVSKFSKRRIVEILKVKPNNIHVVYNGLSEHLLNFKFNQLITKEVKECYHLPDSYILSLSTLEPRKNLRILIEAYSRLVSKGSIDYDLVLAGRKGWMIDNLLSGLEKKVIDRIHITGFIQEKHLPYIYQGAKLFVFPSLYEGFGVPPIEAMHIGTVVISSDAASLPEILRDGCIYFKNNDSYDLENKIEECIMENNENLKEKAKKISSRYTWEDAGKRVLEIINEK